MVQKNKVKELRMYCIALRHLSPIQKGIQCQHATVEYSLLGSTLYEDWAKKHKTTILLETYSSNHSINSPEGLGLMEQIERSLREQGIPYSSFREPDINYATTAICIIVSDIVFDHETYPTLEYYNDNFVPSMSENKYAERLHDKYYTGKQNLFLKTLLKDLRLAT